MSILVMINLIMAFLLEISLVFITGYWGVNSVQITWLKYVLGGGLPVLLILLWGKFLAPASTTRLREPALTLLKVLLFSMAALALFLTGNPILSAGFWVVSMVNLILLYNYSTYQERLGKPKEPYDHS